MTHQHNYDTYTADMLSVEEARDKVLDLVKVLDNEEVGLMESIGQVIAEDIYAELDIPPFQNSAMDGYAVRHQDIKGASPNRAVTLKVVGSVAAGQMAKVELPKGTAIRIMTGAPLPPGADTVVPFEETDELIRKKPTGVVDEVSVLAEFPKGEFVRPAAEDVRKGNLILRSGTVIRPSEIGVLASLGYDSVTVNRRPLIGILATGNELAYPGKPLGSGEIYDSNSNSVAALVKRYGGIPKILGIAKDNFESVDSMLSKGIATDLLITSAGVSKGDYDIVKDVLAKHGRITFWSVKMRPAKPIAFGEISNMDGRKIPLIGLPGNPVSAVVAFEQLARPAILKMMGKIKLEKPYVYALLEDPIINTDGRRVYARAIVNKRNGKYYAKLTGPQGSNILTSMAKANGLAICDEAVDVMKGGDVAKVEMLDWEEVE